VVALAASDHAAAEEAPCALVASVDLDEVTAVARVGVGPAQALVGAHRRIPLDALASAAVAPPEVTAALGACSEVAVIARPPLHARADLLPAGLPWWFAGDLPSRGRSGGPDSGPRRAIEVLDARPLDPTLPLLPRAASRERFDASLAGAGATPARVLAALETATYAELHVHGIAAAPDGGAAYLALSPEPGGAGYALRADRVREARLRRAPLVVLAACRAAAAAPYLRQRWTLPDAFVAAGASAVVAADVVIPDARAREVFDELHRRVGRGEPVAAAVAALRASAPPDAAWVRRLMVFR
jgi:hypothetical protein